MKRTLISTIIVVFCFQSGLASKPQVDSIQIMKRLVQTEISAELKLKFINKLCAEYWNIDPDSSLWYGWQGLPLLKEKPSPRLAGYLHFVLGMAWENKGNSDSAMWYLNKAKEIFQGCGEKRLFFRAIEQIGSLYRIEGQYDTAVVLMNSALTYFKSTGNNYQIMSSLFNIGSVYLEQNRFNKALEYYQASAGYDKVLKDTSAMATHLLGIGNIYLNLGNLFKPYNPEKSLTYFSLSRRNFLGCATLFKSNNHLMGRCFTSMSMLSAFIGSGMYKQADSLLVADSVCLSFPDPRILASIRSSQAQLLNLDGKKSEALTLLSKIATNQAIVILPEFHDAMLLMASLLWENGNRDSARRVAVRSMNWAKHQSIFAVASSSLSLMAQWFEADGKPGRAFAMLQEASLYKDSLFMEIGKEIFDETELKFKNQILRSLVVNLEAEQKLQTSRNWIIRLAGTALILLLTLIITWLLFRHKRIIGQRTESEQKMRFAEQEHQLRESELEKLYMTMQLKEQELIYHTLQTADLSQVNRSIKEKLAEFQHRFQKKKDQDDYSRMMTEVHRDSHQDPLNDFEVLFRNTHPGFYEKLLEVCPDFSKTELQICAFVRMNLASKDIARMVNLTAASVDVTRSHIRKKLALDQSQSLTSYLIMMG